MSIRPARRWHFLATTLAVLVAATAWLVAAPHHFGDGDNVLGSYACFGAQTLVVQEGEKLTRQVGTLKPNAWGLYDMHGNVSEWCQDWYGPYGSLDTKDPLREEKVDTNARLCRGGSWNDAAGDCRAAFRGRLEPDVRNYLLGLRVCVRLD